jgi:hypothetical protein
MSGVPQPIKVALAASLLDEFGGLGALSLDCAFQNGGGPVERRQARFRVGQEDKPPGSAQNSGAAHG